MLNLSVHEYIEVPTERVDLRPFAYPVYRKLRERFASNEVFLLESLGKNAVDARTSMVGLAPLLSIRAYVNRVEVLGDRGLISALLDGMKGKAQESDGGITVLLADRSGVWDVFRDIEQAIFYEKSNDGCSPLMFGYFSYDTIHFVEKIGEAPTSSQVPTIELKLYETIITLADGGFSIQTYSPGAPAIQSVSGLAHEIEGIVRNGRIANLSEPVVPVHEAITFETSKDAYLSKARVALEHIRIGDIYQVQIGQRIEVRTSARPEVVYERMRILNPSPYMYLFDADGLVVVGASPELFVRIDRDEILMRPIAGTLGKKPGVTFDMAADHLRSDEKEVAEHMMLVDLCRNDLHRVSDPQSVEVSDLKGIEEYSHVWHMVSTTLSKIEKGNDKYDVIAASFPAGTMTGAPKIRAMEIIQSNEDSNRGLYAGAVGVVGVGVNSVNTALCIRTAVCANGVYSLRASAGIVSDSVPEKEYLETLHKMGAVYKAVTGEELV